MVLVGSDPELGRKIEREVKAPISNWMGKTSFAELQKLLEECDGLLTNDSGPGHLMSALGKPVWILWGGTADPKIWSPRGENVHLFTNPVPCAPCSLSRCPVPGHPCLDEISVSNVYETLNASLVKTLI